KGAGKIVRTDADLNAVVLYFAGVDDHVGITGGQRYLRVIKHALGNAAVVVHRKGQPVIEKAGVHAHVQLGRFLPGKVIVAEGGAAPAIGDLLPEHIVVRGNIGHI